MKKMKFFAMAFAAIVAVAFSACNQNPPTNPGDDNGNDTTTTPTQVEVALEEMSVLTYRGESMSQDYEEYSAVFTNETTKEQYSVSLISYPNELQGPNEATYTITSASNLTTNEQAAVTKTSGETDVEAESGNIVIKGNASEMEITINITLADGEQEKLHYKGAVTVVENDFGGMSEPTTPVTIALNSDTAIYYFNAAEGDYLAQTQILMVDANQGLQVELFLFYQSEANAAATEQPVGTFKLNANPTESDDYAQVGDYLYYYYYSSMGQYPAFANILAYDASGNTTALFFPQTGDIVVNKGDDDTYKITLNNFVTYNGSKFSAAEFVAHKYVKPASAPLKVAAKPMHKINISLFNNVEIPAMKPAHK